MADKWFAECLPCHWQETYDSETGAIEAASNHVMEAHRNVTSEERAKLKMGHVQLRTEEPQPAEPTPQQQLFSEPSPPSPVEETVQPSPAAETTAEEHEPKFGRQRGRKSEVY